MRKMERVSIELHPILDIQQRSSTTKTTKSTIDDKVIRYTTTQVRLIFLMNKVRLRGLGEVSHPPIHRVVGDKHTTSKSNQNKNYL